MMSDISERKKALRQRMRLTRQALSVPQKTDATNALLKRFSTLACFTESQNIAFYMAHDHEIDPASLLRLAHQLGKQCYLPALNEKTMTLGFLHYQPDDPLIQNKWGILEPLASESLDIEPSLLDLVCVPLVAFDTKGERLGMGKGYYDHTFAFKGQNPHRKPFLLGLAYDCQAINTVPVEPSDIRLNGVLTETGYQLFGGLK